MFYGADEKLLINDNYWSDEKLLINDNYWSLTIEYM